MAVVDDLKAQVQKAIREAIEARGREWRQALIGLFAVALSGCAQHAVDAVKEMRSLACAGDSAAFFSHVDRKEVVASAIQAAEKKTEAAVQRVDPLQQATFRDGANDRIKTSDKTVRNGLSLPAMTMMLGPASPNLAPSRSRTQNRR